MSLHDPVTGLPTRRLFLERARQALRLADRRESRVGIVLWRPLRPEEGGGASAGTSHDRTMLEISRQLRANVRASDLVARIGQEEFALLLTGLEDEDGLRGALERLARRPSSTGGMRLQGRKMDHRAGAALYPDHGARVEDLLTRAREALEEAAAEREDFRIYRRGPISPTGEGPPEGEPPSLPGLDELRSAVEEERLQVAFQPVVSVRDRELEGMEALLQLPRTAGPVVPARSLRPLLREAGLAERADGMLLEAALRRLSEWDDEQSLSWVAVELTVETVSDRAFPDRLGGLANEAGAELRRLVVALPADDARNDPEATRTAMKQLRAAGARIALAGVGGGPLPLAPFGERPLHFLKLATSAVRDLHLDRSRGDLVRALVGLGHSLDAQVVAEGVQSGDELRRLAEAGCDLAQGFHLGAPRPAGQGA